MTFMKVVVKSDIQSDEIEDASNVQVQHFLRRPVRSRLERATPCCTGICDQNIDLVFRLLELINKHLNLLGLSDIGRNANSLARDWKFVELFHSLVNALLALPLPRRDNDLLRASKQKCSRSVQPETS